MAIRNKTDISTSLGIFLAAALIGMAIYLGGGNGGTSPAAFLDVKSVLIVIGGTLFLLLASFSGGEIISLPGLIVRTTSYSADNYKDAAMACLELAEIARKRGILGLQNHEAMMARNPLLQKGLNMIIDGASAEEAERIVSEEIEAIHERHRRAVAILRKGSEISPAMGLVGTLIGLVQMLGNLSDPSTIGPAMAVALLTTLYGALLAYVVFLPLASKLERNAKIELLILTIYLHSITSIARKENPRKLEMQVNALIPPSYRVDYFA